MLVLFVGNTESLVAPNFATNCKSKDDNTGNPLQYLLKPKPEPTSRHLSTTYGCNLEDNTVESLHSQTAP